MKVVNCPCGGCGRDTFHVGRVCSECGETVPEIDDSMTASRTAHALRPNPRSGRQQRIRALADRFAKADLARKGRRLLRA